MEFINKEKELNINSFSELIDCIFVNTPKHPNYFTIYNPNILLLTTIMLNGAKKIFGHVNPHELSETQFSLLQEYMKSIGYKIKYEMCNDNIKIWFDKYTVQTSCHGHTVY
jgi:hypothetical protein